MQNYRQGDVYLFAVSTIPTKEKAKNKVLAYGEVTGHRHQVINGEVFVGENGELFLQATEKTKLKHVDESNKVADHKTIDVEPGNYRIKIQEEYQPEGWKQVVD